MSVANTSTKITATCFSVASVAVFPLFVLISTISYPRSLRLLGVCGCIALLVYLAKPSWSIRNAKCLVNVAVSTMWSIQPFIRNCESLISKSSV